VEETIPAITAGLVMGESFRRSFYERDLGKIIAKTLFQGNDGWALLKRPIKITTGQGPCKSECKGARARKEEEHAVCADAGF